jgi:hypothetical protein
MSGRSGKIRLAEGMGLLTQDQVRFIEAVSRIRNRYAHNVKNMPRPLTDMVAEELQGNGRVLAHLTGIQSEGFITSVLGSSGLRLFMYHRLADYLADALHTLRPPALPMGGLYGLFNDPASNSPAT